MSATVRTGTPPRRRIVIVGNGMVGHRFCAELVAREGADFHVICVGEEPRPAYDRVHLTEFFSGRTADELQLADASWYAERGIELRLGERVVSVDRESRRVMTSANQAIAYDDLVLATGSAPFVPPLPGTELDGVFVYRTIEDLEAIRAWGVRARRAAVIGGGLLGLEAAKAVHDMGLETHVVEFAPRLMPRQVDAGGGEVLRQAISRLGVRVHVGVQTEALAGPGVVQAIRLRGGVEIPVDMVIVSAGIRPRDELARAAGLAVGERGGIVVDTTLATSDPHIFCIGESALANGMVYGLVAPGYDMARTLAARLCGEDARFTGADLSTKLKLLGVEVASFGDAFADETLGADAQRVVVEDRTRGIYQKLVISNHRRLLGGVLVGDSEPYAELVAMLRSGCVLPERPHELLVGSATSDGGPANLDENAQICACNQVTKGAICAAIRAHELTTLSGVKACTRAGTGCGGCVPFMGKLLEQELAAAGRELNRNVCEHFPFTRQELFQIVKLGRIESFEQLLAGHGSGGGCEICRPAVASILASTWNDLIVRHATIQDTNDRFLANIQRGGTYSVVPRIPGGEITPQKLIAIGEIAQRFDLYCKITGGQRIDLLGARVEQLPDIWEALVAAGFESGHAYGKAMRTVKSCVGSTWCRFGVQDSTALAIRIEERYRGIRAPHKLKSAVSGCIRECAEAQSKDFGVIATEKGWNLYVGGNGGSQPRHADLIAADVDEETLIRLIDRFLIYYIQTANPLERTARWLERLDGGLEYLKRVIVDDALGICSQLERDMQSLVDKYECEWAAVVRDPARRAAFRHFANSTETDPTLGFVRERDQRRPKDWPSKSEGSASALPGIAKQCPPSEPDRIGLYDSPEGGNPSVSTDHVFGMDPRLRGDGGNPYSPAMPDWVRVARTADVPPDGGVTVRHGDLQIAVFNFATHGTWYACQAMCPHRGDMVLGRGLLGTQGDEPKVACPMHKKTFSLETGAGLADPQLRVATFGVEVRDGDVYVAIPHDRASLARSMCSAAADSGDVAVPAEVQP
jgi:nitrite reductase (NADH) large subunit